MSRLNKSVATATGRLGVGVGKRLQEIPELMPQLGFLPLQGVGQNQRYLLQFDHAFLPKGGEGLRSRAGSHIL